MLRLILVVAALYAICCSMALGQAGGPSGQAAPASEPPRLSSREVARNTQRFSGSLMKAALNTETEPASVAAVSFTAVPEPPPKTLKKHDLVTVIVREESELSSEATSDLKKQANFDARIDQFVKFDLDNFEIQGGAIGPTAPSVKMGGTKDFKGEATVDRTDRFVARITAEVVDVKPNGTLVLQARKRIKTDEETQEFILTGVARAGDVLADNTILSTQLYDLALEKNHTGAVRNATERGWLVKLLDALSPF